MTLINNFLTGSYTVTRSGGGSYVNGIWTPNPSSTIEVSGSLQPMSMREAKLAAEEGERLTDMFKFYSDVDLRVISRDGGLSEGDVVTINGDAYKVLGVEKWQGLRVDLPHYKHMLKREPQP